MMFKKIKAYKFIQFLNEKSKYMISGISQIVFLGPIRFEEINLPGNQNIGTIRYSDYHTYDFFINIQKPYTEAARKGGAYGAMPHYVIPYNNSPNHISEIDQIQTVKDFISIFYPAPIDIKFKICAKGTDNKTKSYDLKDMPEAMNMDIKSVDFLKTCIRINV